MSPELRTLSLVVDVGWLVIMVYVAVLLCSGRVGFYETITWAIFAMLSWGASVVCVFFLCAVFDPFLLPKLETAPLCFR